MSRSFDSLFSQFDNGSMFRTLKEQVHPVLNRDSVRVTHEDEHTVVAFELPGFNKDEITLNEDCGTLKVRARQRTGVDEASTKERSYTYSTGQCDLGSIEATLRNGVLEVRFEKTVKPKSTERSIEITE